jgi:hypothetical protein
LLHEPRETVLRRRKTLFILTQLFFLCPTAAHSPFLFRRNTDYDHTSTFHPCHAVHSSRHTGC